MDYIYILGIVLFIVFVLSCTMIIILGFSDIGYGQIPATMFFSGLFATALVCLATSSNIGINWLANITLLFGVIALICGLISNFIKDADVGMFWFLALLLIPLGIFCHWWVMTQEYIFHVLDMF